MPKLIPRQARGATVHYPSTYPDDAYDRRQFRAQMPTLSLVSKRVLTPDHDGKVGQPTRDDADHDGPPIIPNDQARRQLATL